ncbi:hypothetical protein VPH35_091542 [Triticum aestivum]
MSRPSPTPAPALYGGVLLEEILEEIFLRLPPQPSSLPRASLVCTRWRRILSEPGFLRRFREHHRRTKPPPLLGFFDHECVKDDPLIFNPTMGQPDRIPPTRFSSPWSSGEGWNFVGCRHGLALLICLARREAVVWDPLTGHLRRVAFPPGFSEEQGMFVQNAAAMCAQDGHVHGDCPLHPISVGLGRHGSMCTRQFCLPLRVGFWCGGRGGGGGGGDIIVSAGTSHSVCHFRPGVLVRGSFCWLLFGGDILEFDFQSQISLTVTGKPADSRPTAYVHFHVVRTEHSGLGLAERHYLSRIIKLWERKSNRDGVVGWELQKTIQLDGHFSTGRTRGQNVLRMQGSERFINLIETRRTSLNNRTYYPYRNFYITGSGVGGAEM